MNSNKHQFMVLFSLSILPGIVDVVICSCSATSERLPASSIYQSQPSKVGGIGDKKTALNRSRDTRSFVEAHQNSRCSIWDHTIDFHI